jgi:uncharacterized protein YndB with AHSA1/START domain
MAIIETSIIISQPVEKVFAFLSDLNHHKKLNPTITDVVFSGNVDVGTKFKIKGKVMGRAFESDNEVVAFEQNKKLGIKTLAAPPASDVTNTYTLEKDGSGTKLHLMMDTVIMAPGMEDFVKNQVKAGLDTSMNAIKRALEG